MTLLDQYITENLSTPFAWGRHDCVLFAAGWALRKTGTDYLLGFPKWGNRREALEILGGHDNLRALTVQLLGQPTTRPTGDGNVALLAEGKGGLCITCGPYVVGPSTPQGLGFFPLTDATDFWSLP
jgi:hypothetical protein